MVSKRKRQWLETDSAQPISAINIPFQDAAGPLTTRETTLYDSLSSEDSFEREHAAEQIIFGLIGAADGSGGVSDTTLLRHFEKKLFVALASGRKCARLGRSIVITELLKRLFTDTGRGKYSNMTIASLLDLMNSKLKPEGDLSGQEIKDHFLGLLFGLQSFITAGILFGDEKTAWPQVLETLIELAKKKPWIREACGRAIAGALDQMDQPSAEQTLETIQQHGLALSPEGVGVWLLARRAFPDMRFPSKPWGLSGNPLDHLKDLGKALKESSSPEDEKATDRAKQTGTWNPQPHFAWKLVLEEYARNVEEADAHKRFENFWKITVDDNLFSDNASPERKFWGFLLFQHVLETSALHPLIQAIFSPNLVRCIINHASKEDRVLNRAASQSLKTIVHVAELYPPIIPRLISGIVGGSRGVYNFDTVTRSHTVDAILSHVEPTILEETVRALLVPTLQTTGLDKDIETRRQLFGGYLVSLLRRTDISTPEGSCWVAELGLPILADFAYSTCGYAAECKPVLTPKTRTLYKDRLATAFTHILSRREGFVYPANLLAKLTPDAVLMDAGILAAKEEATKTMKKLAKTMKPGDGDVPDKKSSEALSLLYALMIFQLYNGEPDAISVLDELKICYEKLVRHKDTEENDEASVVLVEVLLSLISRPSKLLKRTGQFVFEAFTDEITEEGLKLLTDILETRESLKGQQDMFDEEGDNDEVLEDTDGDDDELDSDVEIIDVDDEASEEYNDDKTDDEDEEAEEEDDDDDGDEEDIEDSANSLENQALDAALEAALGTHRLDKDLKAEESDSDADMSDSEMLELDNKLVEIFTQQKKQPNKKKEEKFARENILNFKRRVLDLLDIYVRKQPAGSFHLVLPLLTTVRTTNSKDVAVKAHGVLNSLAKAAKRLGTDSEIPTLDELLDLLRSIHEEACKDRRASLAYAKAASTASLLICSTAYRGSGRDEKVLAAISKVYEITEAKVAKEKKKLHQNFFTSWENWLQSMNNS